MEQLRDYWKSRALAQGEHLRTNVLEALGETTLDIISRAGQSPYVCVSF